MNYFPRLLAWTVAASLAIFGTYAWLPHWLPAIGVILGGLSVFMVVRIKGISNLLQTGLVLGTYLLILALSYAEVIGACYVLPAANFCAPQAPAAIFVAGLFFVGSPVIAFLLLVRMPAFLSGLLKR